MDEIAQYNLDRWQAMVQAQAVFTRPWLDLTPDTAQAMLDPDGRLGPIAGKQVLCLAGGGGQQSAAFALLGGFYWFNCANPFVAGLTPGDWDGNGYPLRRPYQAGAELTYPDEAWVFRGEHPRESINAVREYRHTLSTLINGLLEHGFALQYVMEEYLGEPDAKAAPGTNEHFSAIVPPWLEFWACYRPSAHA